MRGTTLRALWPAVEVKDMRPLVGGEWATKAHLRVAGQPDGVPDDVVLRVAPDAQRRIESDKMDR
jgi:hypothetical protein